MADQEATGGEEPTEFDASVAQEVLPGLWLGPVGAAGKESLAQLGVGGVVSAMVEAPPGPAAVGLAVLHVAVKDDSHEGMADHFQSVSAFIQGQHKEGKSVLVHCSSGVSRSATLVIAHCVLAEHMTLAQALARVHGARPVVAPNATFFAELQAVEVAAGLPCSMQQADFDAYGLSSVTRAPLADCVTALRAAGGDVAAAAAALF